MTFTAHILLLSLVILLIIYIEKVVDIFKKIKIQFNSFLSKIDLEGADVKKINNEDKRKDPKTYVNENGYRCFIDSHKSVSRWIVEKEILKGERKLLKKEVVHHIDGDKLNNSPSNLQIFENQYAHDLHHRNQLKYTGSWHAIAPTYNR